MGLALAGLAALAVAMGVGRFAFTPLLPMMQEDGALSVTLGGWLAAANYAGYLAGSLAAVKLRLAPGTAQRSGLGAIGVVTLAMGLTDGVAAWLLLRFVAGVGSALVLIYFSSWCLEQLAARGRASLGGVVFTGVGIGIAGAGLICLALMSLGMRAATAWLVLGVVSLVVSALLFGVAGASTAHPPPAGKPAPHPDTLKLILCYGAYGLGYILPATFIPAMAREIIADPAVFGWAWPLFGAAAAISTLVTASLAARSPRLLWAGCHFVMAAGVAMPALFTGLWPIMVAAVCVGSTFVTLTLACVQEARRLAGTEARALLAAVTAAFAAGQVVGPIIGVAIGIQPALLGASALLAASGLWLLKDRQ